MSINRCASWLPTLPLVTTIFVHIRTLPRSTAISQDFRFEFCSTLRKVRSYRSSLSEEKSNNSAFRRLIISLHKNTINVRSPRTNGIFPQVHLSSDIIRCSINCIINRIDKLLLSINRSRWKEESLVRYKTILPGNLATIYL